MDQPPSERHKDHAEITGLSPDMRVGKLDAPAPYSDRSSILDEPAPRPGRLPFILGIAAGLVGLAALAASAFVYAGTRQEILRLSTELAQLRVSLDLYARGNAPSETAEAAPGSDLSDLSNRLSILEQNWRSGAAPAPSAPAATTTASGEDCLPSGMRILVAVGDSYPICEIDKVIDIAAVENGYVTLGDGTTIPSGGSSPLVDTRCTIGVTSSGDEGLTGYGEIRVNC